MTTQSRPAKISTDLFDFSFREILEMSLHEFAYRARREPINRYSSYFFPRRGDWRRKALAYKVAELHSVAPNYMRGMFTASARGSLLVLCFAGVERYVLLVSKEGSVQTDLEVNRAWLVAYHANLLLRRRVDESVGGDRRSQGVFDSSYTPYSVLARRHLKNEEVIKEIRDYCRSVADIAPFRSEELRESWLQRADVIWRKNRQNQHRDAYR